ncbi:MAG: glutathione S-transferase [Rhodospirillaceae bacterium]|jgi:glutathione S-transferase|nr:glutathione S-transferase [Rhodospirillaceae bacterium]MBT3492400.1 glutathione S-transferase [Rhodospirillaceae bacterium]MBT3781359.1 glutathione S-transferase [Rhodospirillaceae bacterium]MBT3978720.1 glutathione S-transferase [Rhodospirillaceae bacterium]MBT4169369.1 glutathione S-transferase [Rhodospirillaceae bacterium]
MKLELHQFPSSHFNEKARWALDYKGLEHSRLNYLPGPHMRPIKKLSSQRKTPVLKLDNEIVAGSAQIIDRLEQIAPLPALYPRESSDRAAALMLQRELDENLGPSVRLALFSEMLDEGAYFCRQFSEGKSLPVRLAYRAAYPMAKGLIKKGNGLTGQDAVDAAYKTVADILDEIAEKVSATGFLVGKQFSVADLTAAALLAPAVNPPNCDMTKPEPIPKCVVDFLARWSDHPTTAWVLEIYGKYRAPKSANVEAARN